MNAHLCLYFIIKKFGCCQIVRFFCVRLLQNISFRQPGFSAFYATYKQCFHVSTAPVANKLKTIQLNPVFMANAWTNTALLTGLTGTPNAGLCFNCP